MDFLVSREPHGFYEFSGYRKWLYDFAQGLRKNKFNFKLALVLRKLVLQNKVQVVDAAPLGIKIRFYPLDNLNDRLILFMPKFFDEQELGIMESSLKEDSVFIDIGANAGYYSLLAAKKIESGKIISFEPNPVMADRMKMNMVFNNAGSNIELFEFGLADREGEFDLHLDPTNLGASSMVLPERGIKAIKIKCYPLHWVLKTRVDRIDILKIDIEGADAMVMRSFFAEAPKEMHPRIIFIETDEGLDLENIGYKKIGKGKNAIYKLAIN
ncbi:MAG: FkbM family methyltransferase [Cyclobacteriaceae bacterium]